MTQSEAPISEGFLVASPQLGDLLSRARSAQGGKNRSRPDRKPIRQG
ncbi:hypothetical protein [Streptomyces bobili]